MTHATERWYVCFIALSSSYMYSPTLHQYLLKHLVNHPDQNELVMIMTDLATIGKYISRETNRAGVAGIIGEAGYTNVQNENVKKLDVLANELCKSYLKETGHFAALASEEEDTVVDLENPNATYVIAFDPLDGSTNIEVNVSIGTIFSVLKRLPDVPAHSEQQFLQKGKEQVLAGYILYGTSTVLVFSFGDGVYEFTLDQSLGEFLLSRERLRFPQTCEIYSCNEGNLLIMKDRDRAFIEHLRNDLSFTARYVGSLVVDVHRTLIKGGIFLYPAIDKEHSGAYKGKLRLNYELKPLAFLVEQAGGLAVSEKERILEMQPKSLHERIPVVLGNTNILDTYLTM